MTDSDFDASMMARAMALAAKGAGRASPNPLVGAVVVKGGRVIGEGFHRAYGGPHAEAEALAAVAAGGGSAEGATLYCNLEPCCYRSPEKHQAPCTELIIRHKLARVVVANRDPNPRVDGAGIRALEAAGVRVAEGTLSGRGEDLNEIFFHSMRTKLPFVHLKAAQSLDGRVATSSGDSKWISDERARREVHRLRSVYDAVLVGSSTVRADDPELTVRLCRGRNPYRVVLSSRLDIAPGAKLLRGEAARALVAFRSDVRDPEVDERERRLTGLGARVLSVPLKNGRLDLRAVLERLHALSLRSVLVEGGAGVFTSFVKENLYQKVSLFVAPIMVGAGISALGDLGVPRIAAAPRLARVRYSRIGDQVLVRGYREESYVHGNS
jgi:diaminohydroxyphosphoribosylaminopyrimidine deaminase/5-amino-6-(5-phosphoribosylamino)uracil reductase